MGINVNEVGISKSLVREAHCVVEVRTRRQHIAYRIMNCFKRKYKLVYKEKDLIDYRKNFWCSTMRNVAIETAEEEIPLDELESALEIYKTGKVKVIKE